MPRVDAHFGCSSFNRYGLLQSSPTEHHVNNENARDQSTDNPKKLELNAQNEAFALTVGTVQSRVSSLFHHFAASDPSRLALLSLPRKKPGADSKQPQSKTHPSTQGIHYP